MFLCGEGRFAKQTMERSDFVYVRNEPRSKHYSLLGVLGGVPLGVGVAALRQAQGPLSLGLAMEARGRLPPSKQKKTPPWRRFCLEREKGLLPIRHRFAADCQPYGLDARGLASSSKSAYYMVTSCPRHFYAEPSSRVLATFFSLL